MTRLLALLAAAGWLVAALAAVLGAFGWYIAEDAYDMGCQAGYIAGLADGEDAEAQRAGA
jgi:hypothetical protein